MYGDKIECLEGLLRGHLGAAKTVVGSKTARLTAPGENYGATLVKLDVTLKNNDNGKEEELHTVAKLIPEEEFFRKIFNIQVTCKVEIAFYDTIVPALQKFQRARGVQKVVDFFPKMYASRINLDGSDIVDENAVLLMENLKVQGYQNVSRFESFNLPTIKLILKDLAAFHTVSLAVNLQEPETFSTKIRPYIDKDLLPPREDPDFGDTDQMLSKIFENDEECKILLSILKEKNNNKHAAIRNEPYVTMGHGDLWINNIMVKFEQGKPVDAKFVDFQNPTYTSPVVDLFFLLWTSVKDEVLEQHFDELIQFYHENFLENLRQLKCDTTPFSLDRLLEEMKEACVAEVKNTIFFATFIVFNNGGFKPLHEWKSDDVPIIAKKRLILMAKICQSKGWLSFIKENINVN